MSGFINIPDILANEMVISPLPKTWYEEEFDAEETKTIRFAKRSNHTGVLIKINKAAFYDANP